MPIKDLAFFERIDKNFTTLYVEDNEDVRKQTIKMLKNLLPVIISAKDAEEALETYKLHKYSNDLYNINLIITDIQMPKGNGINLICKIKDITPDIPVIILSAHSNTEFFLNAINNGVDGYLLKPYLLKDIADVLVKTIKKYYFKPNKIIFEKNYFWDCENSILVHKDETVKLTKNELKLIKYLLSSNKNVKPSEDIESYVFEDYLSNNKRVRNLISRLNSKLETNIVESIYGLGYKIKSLN